MSEAVLGLDEAVNETRTHILRLLGLQDVAGEGMATFDVNGLKVGFDRGVIKRAAWAVTNPSSDVRRDVYTCLASWFRAEGVVTQVRALRDGRYLSACFITPNIGTRHDILREGIEITVPSDPAANVLTDASVRFGHIGDKDEFVRVSAEPLNRVENPMVYPALIAAGNVALQQVGLVAS